ncbi:hypothetical protein GEMRC1_001771 [Eukaryota sp. GEM-RC1]
MTHSIPKKPKNGKVWSRHRHTAPIAELSRSKPLKSSFEQKMKLKAERLEITARAKAIREEMEEAKRLAHERRKENERRKKEKDAKPQSFQIVTNTTKLKKIKRHHLHQYVTGL